MVAINGDISVHLVGFLLALIQDQRFNVAVGKEGYSSIMRNISQYLHEIEKLRPAVNIPKLASESEAKTVYSLFLF